MVTYENAKNDLMKNCQKCKVSVHTKIPNVEKPF